MAARQARSLLHLRARPQHTLLRSAVGARTPRRASPFSSSTARPREPESRDTLNPVSTEYSKSGGDQSAAHEDAAFDPKTTSPEAEHEESRSKKSDGNSSNPLNVSPANTNLGEAPHNQGGAERSPNEAKGRQKASFGGSATKAGKPTEGTDLN